VKQLIYKRPRRAFIFQMLDTCHERNTALRNICQSSRHKERYFTFALCVQTRQWYYKLRRVYPKVSGLAARSELQIVQLSAIRCNCISIL